MAYVVARVEAALASDPRVQELGLHTVLDGGDLIVRGPVSTEARKAGVLPVVSEVVDSLGVALAVRDETAVPGHGAPDSEEAVA